MEKIDSNALFTSLQVVLKTIIDSLNEESSHTLFLSILYGFHPSFELGLTKLHCES